MEQNGQSADLIFSNLDAMNSNPVKHVGFAGGVPTAVDGDYVCNEWGLCVREGHYSIQ
jgi:hypothetical protein